MDRLKSTLGESVGPSVDLLHTLFVRGSMLSPLEDSLEGAYVIKGNLARRIVKIEWTGEV
jgi:hypothetical protein